MKTDQTRIELEMGMHALDTEISGLLPLIDEVKIGNVDADYLKDLHKQLGFLVDKAEHVARNRTYKKA